MVLNTLNHFMFTISSAFLDQPLGDRLCRDYCCWTGGPRWRWGPSASRPRSPSSYRPPSGICRSRRFTVTGFLYKLAWRKHTSFWSQNGWSCFVELIKKITANGEVITNLWPTLQEDQNDLLVFKKYTLSKPKLRYFTDLTNYLLSIEDPMLDSQELIVF